MVEVDVIHRLLSLILSLNQMLTLRDQPGKRTRLSSIADHSRHLVTGAMTVTIQARNLNLIEDLVFVTE